jgi:large subunit ribosomal protein L3
MINTLLGTKKSMISSYDSRGRRVGATILELGPNFVTQVKSVETKDGYNAVQIGYSNKKSVRKPQVGLFKKVQVPENLRYLKEVRTAETPDVEAGKEVRVGDIFKVGDVVKVTATSKGKGFQGGVRRHGFHGGPKTHGQSDRHRAPGSIGSGTTPGRVFKGKKMAGHMGVDTVSYIGLEVLSIDKQNNLITIKGGVPGPIGGMVRVERQGVVKGYTPPPEPEPEEEEVKLEENAQEPEMAETVDSGGAKDEAQEVGAEKVEEVLESAPAEAETPQEEQTEEKKEGENN